MGARYGGREFLPARVGLISDFWKFPSGRGASSGRPIASASGAISPARRATAGTHGRDRDRWSADISPLARRSKDSGGAKQCCDEPGFVAGRRQVFRPSGCSKGLSAEAPELVFVLP